MNWVRPSAESPCSKSLGDAQNLWEAQAQSPGAACLRSKGEKQEPFPKDRKLKVAWGLCCEVEGFPSTEMEVPWGRIQPRAAAELRTTVGTADQRADGQAGMTDRQTDTAPSRTHPHTAVRNHAALNSPRPPRSSPVTAGPITTSLPQAASKPQCLLGKTWDAVSTSCLVPKACWRRAGRRTGRVPGAVAHLLASPEPVRLLPALACFLYICSWALQF